jgi:glycosyltransferase involved in cell wall biosynthesis/SAM-dependent methyltransferase/Tfp pilus assembly protein PilF
LDLPPVKTYDNGICREDRRMSRNAVTDGSENFLHPSLAKENMDLYIVRSSILRALKQFLPQCKGVFLDVGCGEMPYRSLVLPHVQEYLGMDIENPVYQKAARPDIFWDGRRIPLDEGSVDSAMATELFEHLPDMEAVLKEIRRVLIPGGSLFFTIPFLWPLHDMPYDEYRYTPVSLQRHFHHAGFDHIQIRALGGWDASLAQMIGLWLKRRSMSLESRGEFTELLFPFYQQLIESAMKDGPPTYDDMLSSNVMITGLTGTAVKPLAQDMKIVRNRMEVECPLCNGVFPAFLPFGTTPRPNALCPRCNSLERHRLLWLFLKERTNFFTAKLKVLDIAPMKILSTIFKTLPNVDYLSIDRNSPLAMRQMDLTRLDLRDDSFDCVFCYHVLEHIPDDRKAMQEVFRVLKPGGWAILQVPVDTTLEKTVEGAHITDPKERERLFGLEDHVRTYGLDYPERLEERGFVVHVDDFVRTISLDSIKRYAISDRENIYFCQKPYYVNNERPIQIGNINDEDISHSFSKPENDDRSAPICADNQYEQVHRPIVAIVVPALGVVSETFVRTHIEHLLPGKTVILTYRVVDDSWIRCPVKIIPPTYGRSKYAQKDAGEIVDFLKHHKVTHILIEYGVENSGIVELNRQTTQLPIFVHFHGYDASQELRKPAIVSYYRWMGEQIDGVVAVSKPMATRLANAGIPPSKIKLIHYGITIPDIVASSPDQQPCRFICISRLVAKKGIIYLLQAFKKAHSKAPAITLDIVGDGPLKEEIEAFIADHGLGQAVRLHGQKPNTFVRELLDKSCGYVQHSVADPQTGDAEGLPNSILEAASQGLPVISTFHEGIPEAVEHGVTGYLVEERDVDRMAEYMLSLAGDGQLRKSMGLAGREKIIREGFTVDAMVESLREHMRLSDVTGPPELVAAINQEQIHLIAMDADKFISICIPTYNRANLINDAIQSVLTQSYKNYEIVIVDDGSTDNTAEVVKGFNSDKIRYVRKEHSGAPSTRNRCVEEARGEFLLWLDDDDILLPDALEQYYNNCCKYPEADIHYCYLVIRHEDGPEEVYRYPEWYKNTRSLLGSLIFTNQFSNVALLIRKSVYEKIGGYNLNFPRAHDYEFFARIAQYGRLTLKLVEKPLVVYRFHDKGHLSGSMKGKDFRYDWRIIDYILEKNTLQELFPDRNFNDKNVIADIYHSIGKRYLRLKCIPRAVQYIIKSLQNRSDAELERLLAQLTNTQNQLTDRLTDLHNLAKGKKVDEKVNAEILSIERLLIPLPGLEIAEVDSMDRERIDNEALVSIIIPCYQQAEFLPEAIESVLGQTYTNWECLIINDGSPDNTSEVANEIIRKYTDRKIRLIETKNGGLPKARNTGMSSAQGEYLLPLDADDRIEPSFLEKAVAVLCSHPKVGFVYSDIQHFGIRNDLWRLPEFNAETMVHKDNVACVCSLMRKAMWEEVRGYNESMKDGYEDWDFWVGCIEKGWSGYHIAEPLFCYRKRAESMLGSSNSKRPYLMARIVLNHPKLYDERKIAWARHTVTAYEQIAQNAELLCSGKELLTVTYLISSILGVTGGNQTLLNQANALVDKGHKVHIVTHSARPAYFAIKADVIHVPSNEPMFKYVPKSDAVISTYFTNTSELTKIKAPVKMYFAQGDQFIFEDETVPLSPELERKKKVMKELSKASYLCPGVKFVANSHNLARAVEKAYGRKADAILPVCVDRSIFHPLSKEEKDGHLRILVVGPDMPGNEIEPLTFKGIGDIKEAFDALLNKRSDFTVVRMSNTQQAIFRDFLCEFHFAPREELKTILYGTADILVYASHYDSCPRPPLEAMASGAAVICTETSGALEYCRDNENCILVPIKSPDALCAAIERLLDNRALRETLVKGGFDTAKQFPQEREWNELEQLLNKFYRNLVNPQSLVRGLTSIVVLLNDDERHAKECIQSIEKHTATSQEIILVRGNCKYNLLSEIKKLIKGKPNYKFIEGDKNANAIGNLNHGILASSGEYVLLLAANVAVTANWLSGMIECLNSAPDVGIVGPMSNNIRGAQGVEDIDYKSIDLLDTYAHIFRERHRHRRIQIPSLASFCVLFKRELIERVGLLDETLDLYSFAEKDLCLRAALDGYRNLIAGDVLLHYYRGRDSIKSKIDSRSTMARDKRAFVEKWNSIDLQSWLGKRLLSLKAMERARELNQQDQTDKAIESFLEAIRYSPHDKNVHFSLTEILIDAKRFKDALDVLNEIPPDDEDLKRLELTGYCKEGLELYAEAQNCAERALYLNPVSASALNLKGILAYRQGDKNAAGEFFKKAIESDPSFGEPHTNLGSVRWGANQHAEGLDLFEKGFVLSPTVMDICTIYHSAVTALGVFQRAEGVFREASSLYPVNKRLKFLLIDILIQQGKYHAAMQLIEEAMITFGIDDGIVAAALEIQSKIEPKRIDKTSKNQGSLSLCMIVKNEEDNIGKCLASIKRVVDEMIIIDTGSTDRTIEVAKAFGAQVYDFKWTNNFAEARNFSLSKAAGDWILVLDADEVISSTDHDLLNSIVKKRNPKYLAYSFTTRNYIDNVGIKGWTANDGIYAKEEAGTGWHPSLKVRLFINNGKIHFEGHVHELVEPSLAKLGIKIKNCSIPIHHYGYLNSENTISKGKEYYLLGKAKLDEKGNDTQALIELARQASGLGEFQDAVELWQKVINLSPNNAEAFMDISHAYLELDRYEDALDASKRAMTLDTNLKEAVLNYSICEIAVGDVRKAIVVLENLIEKVPEYPAAMGAIAAAYCVDGNKDKGLEYLDKIRKKGFNSTPALYSHAKRLIAVGRTDFAISLLEAAVESKNVDKDVLLLLNECYKTRRAAAQS